MSCPDPIGCPNAEDGLQAVINTSYSMSGADRPLSLAALYGNGGEQVTCEAESAEAAETCVIATLTQNPGNSPYPPLSLIPNTPQTCTLPCGESSVSYTAAAGVAYATNQEVADAQAYRFACRIASLLCLGDTPTIYDNTPQTCTVLCAGFGGSKSYTVPAGLFSAESQAEANSAAYDFACEIARTLCTTPLPPASGDPNGGAGNPPPLKQPDPVYANAPQTCSVDCPEGGQYTVTVGANLFFSKNPAAANAQAMSLACNRANANRLCFSALSTGIICVGSAFSEQIQFSGGVGPFTSGMSVVSGALPGGVSLTPGGILSGAPTSAGTFAFTVRQEDAIGAGQRSFTLKTCEIITDSLPGANKDQAYAQQIQQSGASAYTFAVTSGSLPPGLSLDPATGIISGTPTTAGTYDFVVTMIATA